MLTVVTAVVADVATGKAGEFGLVTSAVCDSVKNVLSFVDFADVVDLLVTDYPHFLAQAILNTILKYGLAKVI